ncbi:MAG: histidine--tRNA ligase [Nitrospirae bacterium GWC2_42_7]|nr:MAG: histidine--tRNA ligase [Nitrospirae bacterium GWC2_42_7]
MQDILPPDIYIWQKIEAAAREIFPLFGFKEIRPPIVELTSVFTRSIGENTDIVEKEMYTFNDKAGRSISLRPEGTASVVRAYVENHLHNLPSPQKFFYSGPMFRYERPQSGRFRQFYQTGVELFGSSSPKTDAEVILMLGRFLEKIGLEGLSFQINSIGCEKCRPGYKESVTGFFSDRHDNLCPDCRRRLNLNPLRILDCKVGRCVEMRNGAPQIIDYLCEDCKTHFDKLKSMLSAVGVKYTVNPEMVRGLDYYTRTTFEVTSGTLGAQNAVAAGGRYDKLVKAFGGPETPAVGFAVGMERIVELLKRSGQPDLPVPDIFIAFIGDAAETQSMLIAERIRGAGYWAELGDSEASLKSHMRRADRLSAKYVFIIGDEEINSKTIKWKKLSDSEQGETPISGLTDFLLENITRH